jgi:pimeloyl-ACP methyl ester carboxylesterase
MSSTEADPSTARPRGERTRSGEPTEERLDVTSTDGTALAVWPVGSGPPIVLVHGSLCDHRVFDALVQELAGEFTTFAVDRRGFGASGDASSYSIHQEFEDVAAVVRAVAARSGRSVALFGHSYGANCALGAAGLSTDVHRLVLYEPSLGLAYPPGAIESIERMIGAGDGEGALVAMLTEIVGLSEEEIRASRASDRWSTMLASGPSMIREARTEEGWVYGTGQFDAVVAPTLLLSGSDSPPELHQTTRAAALAVGGEVRTLQDQGHVAVSTAPGLVARLVGEFVGPDPRSVDHR